MNEPRDDVVSRYQKSGNREDFEDLVQVWLPSIRRFLVLQLGNDIEACNDVQQEVLLSLVGNLSGFNGRSQFSTFLYRLVRNKAIDHMRRESRRRRTQVSLEALEATEAVVVMAGPRDDPLESLVRKDDAERLFSLILKLPLADRELLYFREIEELGEKECSVILKKTVGTLKSRLHRIKKKLFQQMEGGERP